MRIREQRNLWGRQASSLDQALDPQRSDLWEVDFSEVIEGLNSDELEAVTGARLLAIPPHFTKQITLPELRIKADAIRQEQRQVMIPTWDDPLDPIKVTFYMETNTQTVSARAYRFLNAWRKVVRAGRDSNGAVLGAKYRIKYKYPVYVTLLSGSVPTDVQLGSFNSSRYLASIADAAQNIYNSTVQIPKPGDPPPPKPQSKFTRIFNRILGVQNKQPAPNHTQEEYNEALLEQARAAALAEAQMEQLLVAQNMETMADLGRRVKNNLVVASEYCLKNTWLSAFKISDLNNSENGLVTIDATLYAEDFEPLAQ